MKVYYDKDTNLKALKGKRLAIIGYGSQGHAHALNLKDSGLEVIVGLREDGKSWERASKDGLKVVTIPEASRIGDVVMILIPDELQGGVYNTDISPNIRKGAYLAFAHGFNIHFGQIVPRSDINVFMVAPKGPGPLLRQEFTKGSGIPALIAVHQDPSGNTREIALAYAKGIGCSRAGVLETTFREEAETDLFGEQSVLCGGASALILAGYETLVEAGYPPELAYFECCHELKLIVDLIYAKGISRMRDAISNTAQYGDLTRGPRIITEETRNEMKRILKEIQSGQFAKEWILDNRANKPVFNALTKQGEQHPIEEVGARLRAMMPWLSSPPARSAEGGQTGKGTKKQ